MARGGKILAITGAVVAVLVAGKVGLGLLAKVDDKTLILEAVKDGLKAGKEGRPGGVLEKLSASLTVNGEGTPGAKSQIADYIKRLKPDVEFKSLEPQVFGEEARIETPATMSVSILGMNQSVELKNVTITLKREDTYEYLIFPKKAWRISDVRVDVSALDMFSGFGGG
jgi:hypothetical protein